MSSPSEEQSEPSGSAEEQLEPGQRFATLLNYLFATRLRQDDHGRKRPYTLREVALATGISIGYLSEARRGHIANPTHDKLTLLASFFEVKPGYFFGEPDAPADAAAEDTLTAMQATIQEALSQPLMGQILLHARAYSTVERAMLLEIMARIDEAAGRESRPAMERRPRQPGSRRRPPGTAREDGGSSTAE